LIIKNRISITIYENGFPRHVSIRVDKKVFHIFNRDFLNSQWLRQLNDYNNEVILIVVSQMIFEKKNKKMLCLLNE
jgi:hypothetical protein